MSATEIDLILKGPHAVHCQMKMVYLFIAKEIFHKQNK